MKRIALLLALLTFAAVPSRAQVNGITAELELAQNQYLPDEDLQLKVKITNRSGQPVTFGQVSNWITFHIVGERNYIASQISEMPITGEFTIDSGQTGWWKVNPTPYFDFRRVGHYRINATLRIPEWGNVEITCKPANFTVANGLPLHGLANLQFGVPPPPGVTNVLPEIRSYSLIKVAYLHELRLYFRLTDSTGRTLSVFPLSGMLSFSEPEAQMDRYNNLHVLMQTGARSFTYSVVTPYGGLAERQTYDYSDTRPALRSGDDGGIFVGGGYRRLAESDIPPPSTVSARTQ